MKKIVKAVLVTIFVLLIVMMIPIVRQSIIQTRNTKAVINSDFSEIQYNNETYLHKGYIPEDVKTIEKFYADVEGESAIELLVFPEVCELAEDKDGNYWIILHSETNTENTEQPYYICEHLK